MFSSLGSGPTGWLLYQQPNHTLAWNLFGHSWSVTAWLADTQTTLAADTWYHVVLRSDGSEFSMYVNGQLASSQAWGTYCVANKDGKSNFGWRRDNDWKPFDGTLNEVAFYRQALTPGQIEAHYRASVQIALTRQHGRASKQARRCGSWPLSRSKRNR